MIFSEQVVKILLGNVSQKSDWKDNYEGNSTKIIGINDNDGQNYILKKE